MSIAEIPRQESEFERVPPHDLNAEQCVLGGMMLSQDAISDVIEQLRASDFYRPAHQVIYDVILDLYGRGEPADAVTVGAELTKRGEHTRTGGAPYLFTLINSVPTAANAGYYAKIVHERSVLRRLVEAGTRIVQLGYTSGADADDLLDQAQAEVYAIADKRSGEDYLPLSEIMPFALDEIEAIGSRDGQMVGVPTGFTDLDALTNGLHSGQMIVVAARPAMGKALALDTPLPTPTGWTTMGRVAVGDRLLGPDGRPTRVVAVSGVLHGRPCFEVEFSDGETITADADHQWLTWTPAAHRNTPRPSVVTTAQLPGTLHSQTGFNHAIKLHTALDLPSAPLPIPPYLLGAHLATTAVPGLTPCGEAFVSARAPGAAVNPGSASPSEAVTDAGTVLRGEAVAGLGPVLSREAAADPEFALRLEAAAGEMAAREIEVELERLEAWRIPSGYLRASRGQRLDLLAGFLDAGATVADTGEIWLEAGSPKLAEDLRELVLSLGYRCARQTEPDATVVVFATDDEVFRLSAKQRLHKERLGDSSLDTRWRYIVDVRPVPSRPVQCVQVDNADHLYLAGRQMVTTHNSTLALDFVRAASIKHGLTSAFFSLEMGRNEITMRLLSAEARVALHAMRSGTMNDDDWARLARRMSEVAEAPLFIDDSPNMSMMEIRAKCRRLKQQHDLRLVVIDYLQLMTSGKRVESRQVEVSEFSRSLKLLAKELQVPVIALSQLNRGPEQRTDKRPMVSDLRESGSIEQDADMVILLHREDAYEKESPRAGEADLIVAKHRNGPTANITVAFQGHYSRFVDMATG